MSNTRQHIEDELTLKDTILKLQEYATAIVKGWKIVVLFCLIGMVGFFLIHKSKSSNYVGRTKNPFKILEVAKSSRLFTEVIAYEIDGDIIGNKLLEAYDLPAKWSAKFPEYENYRFSEIGELDNTDILKQKVIKRLQSFVLGSEASGTPPIVTISLDTDSGIYTLQSLSTDEQLSLALTDAYYTEIKTFFEDEVFANQKQIAEILDAKADSLKLLRDSKAFELARFEDRNRGIIGKDVLTRRALLSMEQRIINEAYATIFAQREMTDISRKDRKPLFVAISKPFMPLPRIGSSLSKKLAVGFGLGIFVSVLFIILRAIYRDVMAP